MGLTKWMSRPGLQSLRIPKTKSQIRDMSRANSEFPLVLSLNVDQRSSALMSIAQSLGGPFTTLPNS